MTHGIDKFLWIPRWLLIEEVRTWYGENLKVPIIRLLKCIKVRVLTCQPSVGRHVDQHDHLPLVVREGDIPGHVQQL